MFYLSLAQNIALIVSLTVVHGFIIRRFGKAGLSTSLASGVLFGAVALLGMMTPVQSVPGVIFDGRSIVLTVAGLFGGPVTALIATALCAAYRIYLGGGGALMGVSVSIESACFGLLWYYLRRRTPSAVRPIPLLALGYIVHIVMVAMTSLLPQSVAMVVFRQIALPVLLIYPPATLLVCVLFLELESRIASEQALRASEALYQSLVEQLPQSIFRKDLKGRFTFANGRFCAGLKRPLQEIVGRTDADFYPPPLAAQYQEADRRVIETGQPFHDEERHQSPHGMKTVEVVKTPLFDAPGKIIGVQGIFWDITERKQAETERERLATAIGQAAEAIIVTDTDGVIQYVNPAFERVSGYTREEAIGKYPNILKSGKQDDSFYREIWETIGAGKTWAGRIINRKKEGAFFVEEATISPVRDTAGVIVNYVAVKRDITNELEMESRLRQAQKMEAIGTLAGGIAHDFNNILFAILGYVDLALGETDRSSAVYGMLTQIEKAGKRAAELVDQILTLSRKRERELKPTLLQAVVREAAKMLRNTLPSTIEIQLVIDEDCPPILGDDTEMHQVVLNLCTNAYHAMREKGGQLAIELKAAAFLEKTNTDSVDLDPGTYVLLRVSDTGTGMDAETLRHIFEPYFTTKDFGDGTGLGLATVHGIVHRYGGAIAVQTSPENGSVFDVFLPAATKSAPEKTSRESDAPVLGRGGNILIVDDELAVVDVERRILERAGYCTTPFTNPEEALSAFCSNPASFDLVLTDQTMPRKTGIELCRELMAVRSGIPVILCSGYSDLVDRERALAMGICAFMEKPLRASELCAAVSKLLAVHAKSIEKT